MALTLGLTGMDPATETALKAAFVEANEGLSGLWTLVAEAEADHIMVDMDSMYGPMSWLRLHAAGKQIIGLTTAGRTQTDFRLGRPFDSQSFSTLLREIAEKHGVEIPATPTVPAPPKPPVTTHAAPEPVASITPAVREDVSVAAIEAVIVESPVAEAIIAEIPEPLVPRETTLTDWLAPDAIRQRVRYQRGSGPVLLIDPATRSYHGPATLKPLAAYFEGTVAREDLVGIDDGTWSSESSAAGAAQPLARLLWLGALVSGNGKLLPGLDADARYSLGKWPQTEREYPKHFRIATAMMKGPATVAEIATASGMPEEDIADFINANVVTGFAAPFIEAAPEPEEPAKSGGLLGRLRGR